MLFDSLTKIEAVISACWGPETCDQLDLTRSQFLSGEIVGAPQLVERPANTDYGRLAEQYSVLSERVASRLRS